MFLFCMDRVYLCLDSEGPATGCLAFLFLGLWSGTTKDCLSVSTETNV